MERKVNKKVLLALLTCYISFAHAVEVPIDQDAVKQLIAAVRNDDVAGVRDAIAKGANTSDPLPMFAFDESVSQAPIKYVIIHGKPNHLKIADILFANGVKQEDLNALLPTIALAGKFNRMLWLLAHGAKDVNNQVRDQVIKSITPDTTIERHKELTEVLDLLEFKIEPKQKL